MSPSRDTNVSAAGNSVDSESHQSSSSPKGGVEKEGENTGSPCDMCSNYEAQLVRAQQRNRELEKQVAVLERTVAELRQQMQTAEETLQELRHNYTQLYSEVMDQLTSLTQKREQVQEQLNK
ncbi:Rab GTPase-binding effector protein 1 [Blattella germanica]|nr:Rab GTPase-binding effector protein 1 [Blattella germanica]